MNKSTLYTLATAGLLSVASTPVLSDDDISEARKASNAAIEKAFNQEKSEEVFEPFDPDSPDFNPNNEEINAYFYAGLTHEDSDDLNIWIVESGVRVLFDDNWSGRANVLMYWDDRKDLFEGMNFGGSGALLYSMGKYNPSFSLRPVIGAGFYIADNQCNDTTACDEDVTGGVFPEVGFSMLTGGIEVYGYTRYVYHPELDNGTQLGLSIGYKL